MSPTPSEPLFRVVEDAGRTAVRFAPRASLTEANAADVGRARAGLIAGHPRPDL